MNGLALNLKQNAQTIVGMSLNGTCQRRATSLVASLRCLRDASTEARKGIKREVHAWMSSTTASRMGGNAIRQRMLMYLQGGRDSRQGGNALNKAVIRSNKAGSVPYKADMYSFNETTWLHHHFMPLEKEE